MSDTFYGQRPDGDMGPNRPMYRGEGFQPQPIARPAVPAGGRGMPPPQQPGYVRPGLGYGRAGGAMPPGLANGTGGGGGPPMDVGGGRPPLPPQAQPPVQPITQPQARPEWGGGVPPVAPMGQGRLGDMAPAGISGTAPLGTGGGGQTLVPAPMGSPAAPMANGPGTPQGNQVAPGAVPPKIDYAGGLASAAGANRTGAQNTVGGRGAFF